MMTALQVGVGIWLGGLFLGVTAALYFTIADLVSRNRRFGYPWWKIGARP